MLILSILQKEERGLGVMVLTMAQRLRKTSQKKIGLCRVNPNVQAQNVLSDSFDAALRPNGLLVPITFHLGMNSDWKGLEGKCSP